MKNADMPAMPMFDTEAKPCRVRNLDNGEIALAAGLTKREMMAMHAMCGLISSGATYGGRTDARDKLARDAIAHADALITELDRTAK